MKNNYVQRQARREGKVVRFLALAALAHRQVIGEVTVVSPRLIRCFNEKPQLLYQTNETFHMSMCIAISQILKTHFNNF